MKGGGEGDVRGGEDVRGQGAKGGERRKKKTGKRRRGQPLLIPRRRVTAVSFKIARNHDVIGERCSDAPSIKLNRPSAGRVQTQRKLESQRTDEGSAQFIGVRLLLTFQPVRFLTSN